MAKDTPKKPDGAEVTPADEQSKQEQAAPGDVVVSADKINELASERQATAKAAAQQAAESEQAQEAEAPASEEQAAPAKKGRGGKSPKAKGAQSEKAPEDTKEAEAVKPSADEKLKQEQEALLKSLDDKAADMEKNAAPKKTRAARPPTGIKKEEPAPPEPETPPEPREAPRPDKEEQIVYINLSDLHPFKNHPFQVRDDEEMRAMVESVRDKGVTQPAVVREREGGGYELVSGHRRQKASELAGFTDMPCIIRKMTDEQAITQMVEDNTNQRENILPSERAKAYKMQLDAIKRQGARDGNSGNGERSNAIVAERNKTTVKQIQRYIKLNDLVPDLMKLADEGMLKFTPAVEFAHVSRKNQQYIATAIESLQSSPNLSQAQRMRDLDGKHLLNPDVIDTIMTEEKKEVDKVILTTHELSQYFGPEVTPREMKDTIMKLLDENKAQQKEIAAPDKKKSAPEKE